MENMKDVRDFFKERGEELQRRSSMFMGISQELFFHGVCGYDEEFVNGQSLEAAFGGHDEWSINQSMEAFERGELIGQYYSAPDELIQYANQS